jgi:PAS domain S-box-containing protein
MIKGYRLGVKLNVLLLAVFVIGTLLTWLVASWIARRQTENEIEQQANLLLNATAGVRAYTSNDVSKLLLQVQQDTKVFLPETVPAYSARTVFENFRNNGFKEFFYKEAGSNPTNRDNKADTFEEGVLEALRKDQSLKTISGYREDFGGQRRFFTAQAMRLTDASCLRCHSTPDKAPAEMLKLYGDKNGFGWEMGDVIAARMVYVPAGHVSAAIQKSAFFVTGSFVVLFGALIGAINLLMRNGVLRPLSVLSMAAQAIAKPASGEHTTDEHFSQSEAGRALERTKTRGDELGELADGFTVMATEVEKRERGLRQAKSQVQQREAYFRALIENASVTYLILDSRYTIRYASPLTKRMLGADPQEITGKLVMHLVPDDNQRSLLDAVERAESKKGTADPFVFKRVLPDGEVKYIEAVVTNLLDQPAIKGIVMVLRDVSERKRLEEIQHASGITPAITATMANGGSGAAGIHPSPTGTPLTVTLTPKPFPTPAPAALENPASNAAAEPVPVAEVIPNVAADPVLVTGKLIELFPSLEPVQQQAIILRLVAAGLASTSKGALPVTGISNLRGKFQLPDTDAIDPGRLIELFLLLADFAVALDTLVWSTWKQLAPGSEVRRSGNGSLAGNGHLPMRKLFGAYLGTESTIPRGQVAYDLERSRALIGALLASMGQAGQEFAKKYRAKFEPLEIERLAALQGGGLLTSKDAKCWRTYRDLATELDPAKMEAEVLAGLAAYAESLMKSPK